MKAVFNLSEVRQLAFHLGIDHELLGEGNKADKVQALIETCQHHGKLADLLALCEQWRPLAAWPSVAGSTPPPPRPTTARVLTAYGLSATGEWEPPPGKPARLFGRESEQVAIGEALRAGRTVLVYGLGGLGKSALAAWVMAHLHEHLPEPVWVGEVGATDLATLCDAIARRLGDQTILRMPAAEKPTATRGLLARHGVWLVLDDVGTRSLARAAAQELRTPDAPLLITSRTHVLVCDIDIELQPNEEEEAQALFRYHAQLPADREPGTVAAICNLLGYHALALVVAGSRYRLGGMPLARLHARLQDESARLATLRVGEDKLSNVRASLALSWADLDEGARPVLIHLAACFGERVGLDLLAAAGGLPLIECEDHLETLIVRSLVRRDGPSYTLHPLVRDFARAMADTGWTTAQNQVLAAAIAYAKDHAKQGPSHWEYLEQERETLLGAADYAFEQAHWQAVVELAQSLQLAKQFLTIRGYWHEWVQLGRQASQAAQALGDKFMQAQLLHHLAITVRNQGSIEEARQLYENSLKITYMLGEQIWISRSLHNLGRISQDAGEMDEARSLYEKSMVIELGIDNRVGVAKSLHQLGRLAQIEGDLGRAAELYQEGLLIKRQIGDDVGVARSLHQLGRLAQIRGDLEEAEILYQESLVIKHQIGDQSGVARTLHQLGRMAQIQGDLDRAANFYEDSLEIKFQLGDQAGVARAIHQLGVLNHITGRLEHAFDLYMESLSYKRDLGHQIGIASTLHQLGKLAHDRGDLSESRAFQEESLAIYRQLGHRLGIARSLHQLALLAETEGDRGEARRLLQEAIALYEAVESYLIEEAKQDLARLEGPMDDPAPG